MVRPLFFTEAYMDEKSCTAPKNTPADNGAASGRVYWEESVGRGCSQGMPNLVCCRLAPSGGSLKAGAHAVLPVRCI